MTPAPRPPHPHASTHAPHAFRSTLREVLALALPLALVQLGIGALGLIDTAIVGRTGTTGLAAVGIGNGIFIAISIFGMGVVMGTEPLIAQAVGAKEPATATRALRTGVVVALLLVPLLLLVAAVLVVVAGAIGLDPDVLAQARIYVLWRFPGLVPLLVFTVFKAYLQAHGRTRSSVLSVLVALVVTVPLDLALVLGVPSWGIPAFGAAAAGAVNTLAQVARFVVVAWDLRATRRAQGDAADDDHTGTRWRRAASRGQLLKVLKVGAPLGAMLALEAGVFSAAALLMGRLGKDTLAAHQIAILLASMSFNCMLGLGTAGSVVVGRHIGAGDAAGALRTGTAVWATAVVVMGVTGVGFIAFGTALSSWFSTDAGVVAAAASLLAVAAAFQLSDGLQAVTSGLLRGAGDTRAAFVVNLIAYWVIGGPLALLFVSWGWGGEGVWWGLTGGLTVAAVLLVSRFVWRARRGYARLA